MSHAHPTRRIQCYHCARDLDIPARTRSLTCPACHKALTLDDLIVRGEHRQRTIRTCGSLVIDRTASLIADTVDARAGVDIQGTVEARVVTGAVIHVRQGARVRADCRAARLVVEPGALVEGGAFQIGAGG